AAHDLVQRDGDTGRSRLGIGVLRLAAATRSGMDLTAVAGPVRDALAEELGETVNVAVLRGGAAVNVHQSQGHRTVALHNWVGDRRVLHGTPSGKMLMAHLPGATLETRLAAPRDRFAAATVSSVEQLQEEFGEARGRGWVVAVEGVEEGVNAAAAPIRAPEGEVVAAVSVAGPAYRIAPEDLSRAAEALVR